MNRDRIERALREPGPRESGYAPESLPATAAELRARSPRRRGLLMSAGALGSFAAAVAAGAVVAVVLVRAFGGGANTGGTVSPKPVASTGPIGACTAGDFTWSSDVWGGAAGSRGTTVLARPAATTPTCLLNGRATLTLRDANGGVLITSHSANTDIKLNGHGPQLEMGITWSNWCDAAPSQPLSLTLTLPHDTTAIPLTPLAGSQIPVPPCNGPGQPSVLSGTAFQGAP
jgi:hypothetical protein